MNEHDEDLARSIDPDAWRNIHKDDADWCQQFADLVRADEREVCAKVCEELVPDMSRTANDASVWDVATFDCAAAIRARRDNT